MQSATVLASTPLDPPSDWIKRTPTEIWSEICGLLPQESKFALMRVARRFHDIAAYEAYQVTFLHGSRGRRCCAMLASGSVLACYYITLIRELTYFAIDPSERYLFFPAFSRVLPHIQNLRVLKIHVAPHMSSFFMYCMNRRIGSKRTLFPLIPNTPNAPRVSVLTFPYLEKLVLHGSTELLPLAPLGNLLDFELTQFLTDRELKSVLDRFPLDACGRMHIISLRLHVSVDIARAAVSISKTFPKLQNVVLEQPNMFVKVLLETLKNEDRIFSDLRKIHLNLTDQWPQYWRKNGENSRSRYFIPMLEEIAASRHDFRAVTFGRVAYIWWKGGFKEVENSTFKVAMWYNTVSLVHGRTVIPIFCRLRNTFASEHEQKIV